MAHTLFPADHRFQIPLLIIISLCLFCALFITVRRRAHLILLIFLLTGMLLAPEKHLPSRLLPLARDRSKVTLEGVVLAPASKPGLNMARMELLAQGLVLKDTIVPLNEKIVLTIYRNPRAFSPGEKIRFTARLGTFKNFRNPGRFDYETSNTLKGITCAAAVSDGRTVVPMGHGKLPFAEKLTEKLKAPVRAFLIKGLDHRNAALFRALILGERQDIDRDLWETFNRSGLGHVLAVSGLHIGLVAWAAFLIFKWVLSRSYRLLLMTDVRKWSAFLTCFPVVGYTLLAGGRVSSERAMIMVLAYLLSISLGKEKDVWSTLSLAGIIILFLYPGALFTPSFQLSFAAVIGILWLTPPILKRIADQTGLPREGKSFFEILFTYMTGLTAVSVAAVYFLLPLTGFYFHRIPLVSVPANLTTIPILGLWILPLGLLSVLVLPLSSTAAGILLNASAWGLNVMMVLVDFWSHLPWAFVWTVTPNLFEIGLFYALTFFAFFALGKRWARFGLAAVTLLILLDAAYWVHRVNFNKDLEVVFLDVGKGNAALVCFPEGKHMMIDGGGFSTSYFDVGEMVVAPYLWHRKIRTVDYLVLTHPQADHMNGLRFIAKAFHPKEFWYNGDRVATEGFMDLMEVLKKNHVAIKTPSELTKKFHVNGARIQILYPGPDTKSNTPPSETNDLNNRSMVLRISYAGCGILFPGDLEEAGERKLLARAGDLVESPILLSPHHGSRTSSSEVFLKSVSPKMCVVSSGEDRFGRFPHASVLKRLTQMGCENICVSEQGSVAVTVSPDGSVLVHSFVSKNPVTAFYSEGSAGSPSEVRKGN